MEIFPSEELALSKANGKISKVEANNIFGNIL
jgi:hypothetical protein